MAQASSISLRKFAASVQSAVAAAVQKHPKFKIDPPKALAISYLIRGFPVPEAILGAVTLSETQAFATDVAAHITAANPGSLAQHASTLEGAIYSAGRHVIIGIPPAAEVSLFEE